MMILHKSGKRANKAYIGSNNVLETRPASPKKEALSFIGLGNPRCALLSFTPESDQDEADQIDDDPQKQHDRNRLGDAVEWKSTVISQQREAHRRVPRPAFSEGKDDAELLKR